MATDYDALVREFVAAFNTKDAERLAPYLHPDIVFRNYGDEEIHGRDAVLRLWRGVFDNFEQIKFETVNQAVNSDVVIAEQIHGVGLPGRPLTSVVNMAVYEMRDGKIAAWRDYTNPVYARTLLSG